MEEGADMASLDQAIRERYAGNYAVMFTDLAGFSRGVTEFGIIHFLQVIFESQRILADSLARHRAELVMTESDSMLVVFREPVDALRCSIEMQQVCADYNHDRDPALRVLLCIGLGYGECLRVGNDDIFGAEVNAASKLGEDIADHGEILMSGDFYESVKSCPGLVAEALDICPPGSLKPAYILRKW